MFVPFMLMKQSSRLPSASTVERRRATRRLPVVREVRDPDHGAGRDVVALTQLVVAHQLVACRSARGRRPCRRASAASGTRPTSRSRTGSSVLYEKPGCSASSGPACTRPGATFRFGTIRDDRSSAAARAATLPTRLNPPGGGNGTEHAHPQELPAVERLASAFAVSVPSHGSPPSSNRRTYRQLLVRVAQDLARRVATVRARDPAAGMRARAAQVQTRAPACGSPRSRAPDA